MAKIRREIEVPRMERKTVEEEVPDGDPAIVHETFKQAHAAKDLPAFIAAALRKAAGHMHRGLSVQRALESAAEEIEGIASAAASDVPGEARIWPGIATEEDANATKNMTDNQLQNLQLRYEEEADEGETVAHFVARLNLRPVDVRPATTRPVSRAAQKRAEAESRARAQAQTPPGGAPDTGEGASRE